MRGDDRHHEGTPVAIVGTTASGKSELAMAVARLRGDAEIVCVDSMTVYRGMDLATAKPSAGWRAEVPHHLLDMVDPSEEYTVAQFQRAASEALGVIEAAGHLPLLVGGTGLYLRSVIDHLELPGRWPEIAAALAQEADSPGGLVALHGRLADLDPLAASRTTPTNRRRVLRAMEVTIGSGRPFSSYGPGLTSYPPSRFTLLGLPFDAAEVDRRVEERFGRWLSAGLLAEVRTLSSRPGGLSRTARQALGYRELLAHVEGGAPLEACVEEAVRRTRSFARRQWSWFRRDPRIRWLDPRDDPVAAVSDALGDVGSGVPRRRPEAGQSVATGG